MCKNHSQCFESHERILIPFSLSFLLVSFKSFEFWSLPASVAITLTPIHSFIKSLKPGLVPQPYKKLSLVKQGRIQNNQSEVLNPTRSKTKGSPVMSNSLTWSTSIGTFQFTRMTKADTMCRIIPICANHIHSTECLTE